jgi:hypothetical protein
MNWGIKGRHWEEPGPRQYRIVNPEKPAYSFGDWEMGHYTLARVPENAHPNMADYFLAFDPDAQNSVAAGFNFDVGPVSNEYTNVMAEVESIVWPIKYGVVSYGDGHATALQRLKIAGYDAVVAEFSRQFSEYMESGLS